MKGPGMMAPDDSSQTGIPTRVLGKTGARVSILAMGGGLRFYRQLDEDRALEALQRALDLGITYIDTADSYGNHLSERLIGRGIKGRREGLFLATKVTNRDGAETLRIVEESLEALQVDRVDLIHIHSLEDEEDLVRIEARGGLLEQLTKLRDQGVTRFIGITGHRDPRALKTALERHDFDCVQMALNGARLGMRRGAGGLEPIEADFETLALPVANQKNMGVIAMKIFSQDAITGLATSEELLYYSLSLPVATAVVGMPKLEHIEENARLARRFKPLPKSEMQRISDKLVEKRRTALALNPRSGGTG